MQKEVKDFKDKQGQLQEYASRLTQDRNNVKLQSDIKDKKIKDLELVIANFATIQEQMIFKKTKKKKQYTVDMIEEIFKQIKEEEKQRLYEEAVSSQKTFKALLSPRGKHVTLLVTDHENNTTEAKIKV